MQKHRSMAYFPVLTGRDEMSKQARFVVRMALACHEAGTPYDVQWKRHGERFAASLTAEGNIPMPKPFPKAPRAKVAAWKPNLYAEASYRMNVRTTGENANEKPIAGWIIEHSSGLCLVKYGESETGELVAAEGEDVRDGWYVTHTGTLKGFGLKLKFQTACKALEHLASLWDGWREYCSGPLPIVARRACLTVRIAYDYDANDFTKLQAMGGPIERPTTPEPPPTPAPAVRTRTKPTPSVDAVSRMAANEARIAQIQSQLASDTQARMNRLLAELRASRPSAPAGKLAVTYPDGRVAYIPDPAVERRVSA